MKTLPIVPGPALLTLVLAGLTGCASAGPAAEAPPQPRPDAQETAAAAPAAAPSFLTPPEGAVRAAGSVTWTGAELGTMWTFENPPLEYWRERYDFAATPEWLEHVRLASVRYGESCSASFVSPTGLVMTNHHCARECIEAVSTAEQDYVVKGFYAATRADELLCPDLFLDQLVEIENVTERVRAAAPAGAPDREVAETQEAEREEIEAECEAARSDGFECQVVTLFHGGQHQLYVYRRYEPVKLVFAPELQAGFFGGDPDNFTYPRYALDVSFVRAYVDESTAVGSEHYFSWDRDGAQPDELVFVTGNPGSTSRLLTLSQVLFARAFEHPFLAGYYRDMGELLQELAARSPEAERRVRDELFSIENARKKYEGELAGLRDTLLLARKIAGEQQLRERIAADPELARQYGDIFERVAEIQAAKAEIFPLLFVANPNIAKSPLQELASSLWLFTVVSRIPAERRPPQFQGEAFEELKREILAEQELDLERESASLVLRLALAERWLGDDSRLPGLVQPGETPEQAAGRIVRATRLGDPAFRSQVLAGTATVAGDPLFAAVTGLIEAYRSVVPEWQELSAREQVQQERLAQALFAVYGADFPPDATFTLRITDGVVAGYPMNGTVAPPYTSLYGLYERAFNFGDAMPFTLPAKFAERRGAVELGTRYNFVTTNDITGGNSGSPMIDREARVVGLAFDGNIEQLPNEFVFRDVAGRTIGVHSAGIVEALRSVYRAEALLRELLGR